MVIKQRVTRKIRRATEGVISILLVIALLPFFSLAAAVIEAERYQNAVKALDEALGSSALSTLAQYDSYLLDRFGLLAVKQTDDESFIETQLNQYLQKQRTTDMYGAGTDTLEAEAEGIYPLADISVLHQQIMNYSAGLVPAKFVAELGQLDALVSEIEKSFGGGLMAIFGQIKSGADMLDQEATLIEDIEDSITEMGKVSDAITAYDAAFSSFESAMNRLYDHYNSPIPEDDAGAAAWEATLASLREDARDARDKYTQKLDDVTARLDALHSKIQDVITSKNNFVSSAASFGFSTLKAAESVELDNTKDAAEKTELKNLIATGDAFDASVESMSNQLNEALVDLSNDDFSRAFQGIAAAKQAVASADTNYGYTGTRETQYHNVELEHFRDVNQLAKLVKDIEDEAQSSGWLDTLLALFDILNELFSSDLFFNPELSVTLDTSYYSTKFGGLPGEKDRSLPRYSLASSYEADDEARSKAYLEDIDPDYDPDDPYGFYAGSTQSKLDALVSSIAELNRRGDKLRSAPWVSKKIAALSDCAEQLGDVIEKLNAFLLDLAVNVLQKIYERILLMGYLGYNLPNRTNFDSGRTLTGFSYSNAALAPSVTGSNIGIGLFGPLLSIGGLIALTTPNKNYSFSGAELEYIIAGSNSEISNQVLVFLIIWLMRAGLDAFPVIKNSEVKAIAEALKAIPLVGIVVSYVYWILIIILEPLLDTFFLVNGGSIRFVKRQDEIFLTPTGISKLAENITKLTLNTEEKKDKVKQTLREKWSDKLGEFDYTQHAVIFMMLLGNETEYLQRLTNIIQAEGTYRSRTDGATASQRALGTYTDFDIEKAYTTMRIEAEGTLKQLLPVPSVLNPYGTRAFDTPLRYDRVLYRGY